MEKKLIPIIVGAVIIGGVILATRKKAPPKEELPPPVVVPYDVEDLRIAIKQAQNIFELNAYYNLIGELFINRELSHVEYSTLYSAYKERWYELVGETV